MENPNVSWGDIIGLNEAKRLVKESVVYPIKVSKKGYIGLHVYICKSKEFLQLKNCDTIYKFHYWKTEFTL